MSGLTFTDNGFELHDRGGNTVNYQVARQGTTGTKQYNAWIAADGSFIIMERDLANTADMITKYIRFPKTATFQTEWDSRTSLTYVEFDALFA